MIGVLDCLTVLTNLLVATFTPMSNLIIMIFLAFGYVSRLVLNRDLYMIAILTMFVNGIPTTGTKAMFAIAVTPMFSFVGFTSIA